MKIEEAAKAHCKNEVHDGEDNDALFVSRLGMNQVIKRSFTEGAKFITDRCYDKERIQRLISHIYEATGHTPLESDMHEIIHILTSEQYEND